MSSNTLHTTVNGISVAYLDQGNKEDISIVFVHGFPLDKSMWSEQLHFFSGKFRTIAYDIRGFGESEKGSEKLSIDLFAEDLNQFIDALSLQKVVLCGFSMGGYIVLNAMQKFPEKIMGLVLADTQCHADTKEVRAKRMKTCESIRSGSLSLFADEMLTSLMQKRDDGKKSKDLIALRSVIENTSEDVLCDALIAMADREASCHALKDIEIPTLILVGEEDSITPIEKSEIMNSKIPGSTLLVIPDAKHLSNIDNPADFNTHLAGLLKELTNEIAKL
jgi:pimeloyl-ACP methyl ester carboxylesterase